MFSSYFINACHILVQSVRGNLVEESIQKPASQWALASQWGIGCSWMMWVSHIHITSYLLYCEHAMMGEYKNGKNPVKLFEKDINIMTMAGTRHKYVCNVCRWVWLASVGPALVGIGTDNRPAAGMMPHKPTNLGLRPSKEAVGWLVFTRMLPFLLVSI